MRAEKPSLYLYTGDWSNGMIGVSKTFGGSSILSSPAHENREALHIQGFAVFCFTETHIWVEKKRRECSKQKLNTLSVL